MSIPDPISAVVAFLAADTDLAALVSTRVFGAELDPSENANMPRNAVVVKPVPAAGMLVGYMALGTNNYDVWCFGADPYQAGQVRLAVYEALKLLNREIANNTLLHWAQESGGAVSFRDPDTDWPVQLQTFQVLAAEVATA
jgi:ABC-type transport system substrate-binding protein